ncbi:UNVERIFIED_CONTAM: hypothetical protein Sradi_2065000 [Sesamum radiatum]|uniref:Uncharacterized protein n=1 Tax=Sesamum radiatum TaxID=300843 RepID=A0AAW2TIW9_SESRA
MGIGLGGFDLKRRKARVPDAKWKNDEAETATANALSAPGASLGEGKGDGKMVRQSKDLHMIFA